MATVMCAAAQVRAQQAASDSRRLRMGVDSLAVYVVRGGDTLRTGAVRDELSTVATPEATTLRRVYVTRDRVLGERVDSIWDRAGSLEPVRQRSFGTERVELDFAPGRVMGTVQPADGPVRDVSSELARGAYNAASLDLVLRSAALGPTWRAEVPVFIPSLQAVRLIPARVEGVERIGQHACWRVAASFVGMPVTFWIDTVTRQLRQQVMEVGPDTRLLFREPPPGDHAA